MIKTFQLLKSTTGHTRESDYMAYMTFEKCDKPGVACSNIIILFEFVAQDLVVKEYGVFHRSITFEVIEFSKVWTKSSFVRVLATNIFLPMLMSFRASTVPTK